MAECKICNKEFVNLMSHVRNKHGMDKDEYQTALEELAKKKMEEYNNPKDIEDTEDTIPEDEEIPEKEEGKDVEEGSGIVIAGEEDRLNALLEQFDISEGKLRRILESYCNNDPSKIIEKTVNELKDLKRVHAYKVEVAETLVNDHGFKVKEVQSNGGTKRKTWILVK